ncbi:MAG: hypothetical protein ACQESD_06985 [Thermoplasmatota archaeon]
MRGKRTIVRITLIMILLTVIITPHLTKTVEGQDLEQVDIDGYFQGDFRVRVFENVTLKYKVECEKDLQNITVDITIGPDLLDYVIYQEFPKKISTNKWYSVTCMVTEVNCSQYGSRSAGFDIIVNSPEISYTDQTYGFQVSSLPYGPYIENIQPRNISAFVHQGLVIIEWETPPDPDGILEGYRIERYDSERVYNVDKNRTIFVDKNISDIYGGRYNFYSVYNNGNKVYCERIKIKSTRIPYEPEEYEEHYYHQDFETNLTLSQEPKLNSIFDINYSIENLYEDEEIKAKIFLPDCFEFISGDLSWEGTINENETIVMEAKVKCVKVGYWLLSASINEDVSELSNEIKYIMVYKEEGYAFNKTYETPDIDIDSELYVYGEPYVNNRVNVTYNVSSPYDITLNNAYAVLEITTERLYYIDIHSGDLYWEGELNDTKQLNLTISHNQRIGYPLVFETNLNISFEGKHYNESYQKNLDAKSIQFDVDEDSGSWSVDNDPYHSAQGGIYSPVDDFFIAFNIAFFILIILVVIVLLIKKK